MGERGQDIHILPAHMAVAPMQKEDRREQALLGHQFSHSVSFSKEVECSKGKGCDYWHPADCATFRFGERESVLGNNRRRVLHVSPRRSMRIPRTGQHFKVRGNSLRGSFCIQIKPVIMRVEKERKFSRFRIHKLFEEEFKIGRKIPR